MKTAHGAWIEMTIAGVLAPACCTLTIGLAATATAAAAQPPVWSGASEVARPAGGATEGGEARLVQVSCSAPGSCAALGSYEQTSAGEPMPMIATETGGAWSQAEAVQLPASAREGRLASISCAPSGPCEAVGEYRDESGDRHAIAVSREGGRWVTKEVAAPGEEAWLESVSCPAAGACSAVGGYYAAGAELAIAVSETSGQWGTAEEVAIPAPSAGLLQSVSCVSAESCVAAGWFAGNESWQAMREERVAGKWARAAHALLLPTESNQFPPFANRLSFHVACASQESCAIAGSYFEEQALVEAEGGPEQSRERAIVASETGGAWPSRAESLELPSNASAGEPGVELDSVSCAPSGLCAAVGEYATEGEKEQRWQPLAVSQATGGVWGQAQQIALPKGEGGYLDSVSCPAPGSCVAVGENWSETSNGNTEFEPIVAAQSGESGESWGAAQVVAMPAAAATTEPNTWFESVSCPAVGACSAVGIYENQAKEFLSMAAASAPALEVSAAGLPSGQVGSPYSAQLSAAGGIGADSFSVAAGSLPAGLTLDAATGAISGTPTAAGGSNFTVKLANPGPPAQSAEAAGSIAIVAAPVIESPGKEEVKPKPLIRVISSRLSFSQGKLKVRLACKRAPCKGAIELTAKLARRGKPSGKGHKGKASAYTLVPAQAAKRGHKHGGKAKTIVLARANYTLAAGKRAAIALRLTAKGRRLLAHLEKSGAKKQGRSQKTSKHAKPLEAKLTVTLDGGTAVSKSVKVS